MGPADGRILRRRASFVGAAPIMKRRVLILGSTGSVGRSALDVVSALPERFEVAGLAANSSADQLAEQARAHGAPVVALADESAAEQARALLPDGTRVIAGSDAAERLVDEVRADVVLQATVGAAALASTLAALRQANTVVALANKESLVMAGPLLLATAAEHGATLVPVDSEHSAIFQCLRAGQPDEVERIILTTSGGALRDHPLADLGDATPEDALRHPTWSMGPRITIDSATMMNKALEVAEAVALFDVPPERIEVVLHPQSIVHSMVEFRDGSVMAQMSRPDMRLPILFALAYPERPKYDAVRFSLTDFAELTFRAPDPARYPALALGYRAARTGGIAGAVLNAADEEAVRLFLGGQIPLPDIAVRVRRALDALAPEASARLADRPVVGAAASSLADILAADAAARREVLSQ